MTSKTLAALVGSLSLTALGVGCATAGKAAAPTPSVSAEKGANGSCGAAGCSAKAETTGDSGAKAMPEKGASGSCGAAGCSGK